MNKKLIKILEVLEDYPAGGGDDRYFEAIEELKKELSTGTEGFMCRTDFECELGAADGGNSVYPSIENLKKNRQCVSECGIVKVFVHLEEIVEPGKLLS